MFTTAEYQLMRENCPGDLKKFLAKIKTPEPDITSGDEFKIFDALDEKVTEKLCRLMKSDSVIDGYIELLTLGAVKFSYGESDNELLAKILQNKSAIASGATKPQVKNSLQKNSAPPKVSRRVDDDDDNFLVALLKMLFDLLPGTKNKKTAKTVRVDSPQSSAAQNVETKPAPFTQAEIRQVFDILEQVDKIIRAI